MPSTTLSLLTTGAVIAAATMTGTATAQASTCADAPVEPVATGAVFSEPVGGDPVAIVRELCGLVRQTPAGSAIQVAHFVMSGTAGTEFADELIKAHRRGVKVRVVLDGDRDARWVITGSHNYNETSLRRNDQTLLKLNDKDIYRQYVANFDRMRTAATTAQG
ncbi:phospholipase D family protein [Nonomuraea sp. SYSU D8015]|uniref:phospholipase D family protein n=1 Tax=Nonomuraea sp. SYSU D8015 TaxID=2593644 RepID=UPI0016603537|nr:phospholipase D family protein [Nonomuraea sp. SYSU D8015]